MVFYQHEGERLRQTRGPHLHNGVAVVEGWTLDAYPLPTGTISVRAPQTAASGVALSARVSSADQQEDAVRQMQRLRASAATRGYLVVAKGTAIASGLNEERPKLKGDGLVDDFGAVITSMAARIYGCRKSKRRAERLRACVEHVLHSEDI
jgi:putative resolvase